MAARTSTRLLAVILGSSLVLAEASADDVSNGAVSAAVRVLPPWTHAYGSSYAEWSAAWWQWAFSMPAAHHPLTATADCSEGQAGQVWFLGFFTGVRDCTIPPGTALFFPVLNVECSTIEGNGVTEEELRACANGFMALSSALGASIDGAPVEDLEQYRVGSPPFEFGPLPDGNILQEVFGFSSAVAGTVSASVSDGVFLMVPPLPVGDHVIQFGGCFEWTGDGVCDFTVDVTQNVTVR